MANELSPNRGGAHSVAAVFESRSDAERARDDLLAAGFRSEDIVIGSNAETAALSASQSAKHRSFLESLLDIFVFMAPHEQLTYDEAIRRGGIALAVRTDAAGYEQAIDILDRDGALNLDEHEIVWQREGWKASAPTTRDSGPGSAEQAGFESRNAHDPLINPEANRDVRERIGTGTADMTAGTDIAPESAAPRPRTAPTPVMPAPGLPGYEGAVAQRDMSHGRARVRGYVGEASAPPDGTDPQI